MFKSALCQIFVLLIFAGYSQERYTLTATIIDKNTKEKLPFATVSLKNPDSKAIIGGAVSDENGFVSVKSPLAKVQIQICLLYTSPSPRDTRRSRMPSSA